MTKDEIRLLSDNQQARMTYFDDPSHAEDILWTNGDEPHGFDFGYLERSVDIHVVDIFGGMRPRYHDASCPSGQGVLLVLIPTLVLDSDIAGSLQAYVDNATHDVQSRSRVERFLQWFASSPQMNLTPAYNLLERFARSTDPDKVAKAESMALRTAQTILKIETMDRLHYLATGRIQPAADAHDILRSQTGTDDFDAIAYKATTDTQRLTNAVVDAFYAFLLKVALINATHTKRVDLVLKVNDLVAFVDQRLRIAGTLEFSAALLQFTGSLRKFVTINRGMSFDNVITRVQHSAWDLAYMRTPQMFLQKATPEKTVLAFVLTGDRDSASIMRLAHFSILLATPEDSMQFHVADFDSVRTRYGNNTIFDEAFAQVTNFFERRPTERPPAADIPALIEELHAELRSFLITAPDGS